jgi:hypothetical protein
MKRLEAGRPAARCHRRDAEPAKVNADPCEEVEVGQGGQLEGRP